jgi:hypothetical protein
MGLKQLILFILTMTPGIVITQVVQQDSTTLKLSMKIDPSTTNNFSTSELNRYYFESFAQSDSILQNERLKYKIHSIGKSRSYYGYKIKGVNSSHKIDSSGTTYYFPMFSSTQNNYYLYFRVRSQFQALPATSVGLSKKSNNFLRLHGNILYEYLYRSRTDTPFVSKNFQQHLEQIYADAVFKDRYPVRFILNSRQTNSPFFKNYVDVSIQFNNSDYLQNIRSKLLSQYSERVGNNCNLTRLESIATQKRGEYDQLNAWINSSARTQEIVEEKEQIYSEITRIEQQQASIKLLQRQRTSKALADSLKSMTTKLALGYLQKQLVAEQKKLRSLQDSAQLKVAKRIKLDSVQQNEIKEKKAFVVKLEDSVRLLTSRARNTDALDNILVKKLEPDTGNQITHRARRLAGKVPDNTRLTAGKGGNEVNAVKSFAFNSQDSLLNRMQAQKDSLVAKMKLPGETEKKVAEQRLVLDSLYKNLLSVQHLSDSVKQGLQKQINDYSQQLQEARSASDLKALAQNNPSLDLPNLERNLLAVTKFGIGRSSINYSDLTVNNISLSGFNIEYNPSFYTAFAVGAVDYLFRDFVVRPDRLPKQKLMVARLGWGDNRNRSFILTAYKGTRNKLMPQGNRVSSASVNVTQVFGYSVEIKYRIDKNLDLSIEGAKSSVPYIIAEDRSKSINSAFVFSDRNNEAWSAKLNFSYPKTESQINAFYRQIGAYFQSYSVFNSGNRQEYWGIRWRQYLWKKHLSVIAQLRKANFDNPTINRSYNSSIVFKSLQVVFRMKKLPVVSVGYMPNMQLSKSPYGQLTENAFYTLTASAFYNYQLLRKKMNSNILYTRFFNKGSDTGFFRYNARAVVVSHSMRFGTLGSLTELQYNSQPLLIYYSFLQKADIQVSKVFSLSIGLRNSWLPSGDGNWGGVLQGALNIPKLGSIQFQYDKGYLPNASGNLSSNNWGRVSFCKIF